MAAPTVNDLDGLLAELNQLKPPGASKTKISAITALCVNNIQGEPEIVKSFYNALKKAPATHKLGVLYVVDSVVRQWIEKAKAAGQDLNVDGRGDPGTYRAAVKRITEILPTLFDDTFKGIPTEQRSKLENLVTIWERGHTFPSKMLATLKARFSGTPPQTAVPTNGSNGVHKAVPKPTGAKFPALVPSRPVYTPTGLPPHQVFAQGLVPGRSEPPQALGASRGSIPAHPVPQAAAPPSDVNSILAALSKAVPSAATPTYPPPPQHAPPQVAAMPTQLPPDIVALLGQQMSTPHAQALQNPMGAFPYANPPPHPAQFSTPPSYSGFTPQPQQYAQPPPAPQPAPPQPADPLAPLRGLLPANILNDHQKLIPALQLLQDLQKDGIPPERWGPVLQAFEQQFQAQPPAAAAAAAAAAAFPPPSNANQSRGRSRSPDRNGRGRGSPVYGAYDSSAPRAPASDDRTGRGGARNQYRQRSPIRNSPAPLAMNGKPMQPKVITYDSSLPTNHIKVLSRTLFVGGANGSQQEIQELFERFGSVQTCIANRDKRHAFVKMTTRQFALGAKAGMEELQSRNDREIMHVARQTKWGVGFGPRECCDYARGESIIPVHKLTEADMKWLLTAEYGGTGGRPVEGGMVLEEPDIEIGAGVSSKAMSKRVGPDHTPQQPKRQKEDRGGRHHHHHGKHKGGDHAYGGGAGGGGGGFNGATAGHASMEPFGYARPEPVAVATPPAVPGFGFSLGLPPANGPNNYR